MHRRQRSGDSGSLMLQNRDLAVGVEGWHCPASLHHLPAPVPPYKQSGLFTAQQLAGTATSQVTQAHIKLAARFKLQVAPGVLQPPNVLVLPTLTNSD